MSNSILKNVESWWETVNQIGKLWTKLCVKEAQFNNLSPKTSNRMDTFHHVEQSSKEK